MMTKTVGFMQQQSQDALATQDAIATQHVS